MKDIYDTHTIDMFQEELDIMETVQDLQQSIRMEKINDDYHSWPEPTVTKVSK